MILVTPAGGAAFISPPFDESCSDRQIFKECGVLDYIEPGDLILGDRGFNVDDLLAKKDARLLIHPNGPGMESALSLDDEILTKVIAKARVRF